MAHSLDMTFDSNGVLGSTLDIIASLVVGGGRLLHQLRWRAHDWGPYCLSTPGITVVKNTPMVRW